MLVHMITTAEWDAAQAAGVITAPSLQEVGFVHMSTHEQVHIPANAHYAGRDDVLLLVLDPDRIDVEVRWEQGHPPQPDGMEFPHAYGPLPIGAVVAVKPYRRGPDGRFGTPELP